MTEDLEEQIRFYKEAIMRELNLDSFSAHLMVFEVSFLSLLEGVKEETEMTVRFGNLKHRLLLPHRFAAGLRISPLLESIFMLSCV
uniref:Uncharacterized protein n=1 Tax=Steinernema glaseri TaxID=37863 RepID=A0A1I7ZHV3_9BILA